MSGSDVTRTARPRIYINAFPKSGTHLAGLMVAGMARKQVGRKPRPGWFGTFMYHAWSDEWISDKQAVQVIMGQREGTWMMGHCGYTPLIALAFRKMHTCVLFVYRDLRDVAVSMTYHIESENEFFKHQERDKYNNMTHRERIIATIEGIGHDPGLIRRWELYAPWLGQPWVHMVRYEDILENPKREVERAVQYIIKRTAAAVGARPVVYKGQYSRFVNRALKLMAEPKKNSLTYRKGVSGEWRKEFDDKVMAAFKREGGMDWIRSLGYG